MTRDDPNEDLQDQVERGRRVRDGERLLPIAIMWKGLALPGLKLLTNTLHDFVNTS